MYCAKQQLTANFEAWMQAHASLHAGHTEVMNDHKTKEDHENG